MRRSSYNPRCINPEYINARELYSNARHYFRFFICWYGNSEIVEIAPRVYARGYASLYRLTLADSQSCIVAWSTRITIIRSSM